MYIYICIHISLYMNMYIFIKICIHIHREVPVEGCIALPADVGLTPDFVSAQVQLPSHDTTATNCLPYRDTSPVNKRPPPCDPPITLGTCPRKGPRGVHFFVS